MKNFLLIAVFLLLGACSTPQGTAGMESTAPANPPGESAITPQSFFTITSPQDGLVTPSTQIELQGIAVEDVILTINAEIHLIPPGEFTIPLTLEAGANTLEIVASNYSGEIIEMVWVITVEP